MIPGETRWNSDLDSLDSILENRCFYTQIIQEHEDDPDMSFDKTMVSMVMDYALYKNAKDLTEQLCPIAIAVDREWKYSSSMADASTICLDLHSNPALELLSQNPAFITRFIIFQAKCHPSDKAVSMKIFWTRSSAEFFGG